MNNQSFKNRNISVVLSFSKGTVEGSYSVTRRVLEDSKIVDQGDNIVISEVPKLSSLYESWQKHYIDQGRSVSRSGRSLVIPPAVVGHSTVNSCRDAAKSLCQYLDQQWFKSVEFQALKEWIRSRTLVQKDQSVPVFFDFNTGSRDQDILLRRLPWSRWDLFTDSYNMEPALGIAYGSPVPSRIENIKILLVLGSDEGGLDLEADSHFVSELQDIGAQVKSLSCPESRVLYQELRKNAYDILFFAGHSLSEEDQRDGTILLQPNTLVSIESLSPALRTAIEKGLKLAIFNSCDGLGLADPLIKREKLPSVVVFREPVPDEVARTFLKYFLEEFSSGKPLFLSVREARNQLRLLEDRFKDPLPGASWLPVVCQNPSQPEIFLDVTQKPKPLASEVESSAEPRSEYRSPPWLWKLGAAAFLLCVLGIVGGMFIGARNKAPKEALPESEQPSEYVVNAEDLNNLVSQGSRVLIDSDTNSDKQEGVEAYQRQDWDGAISAFRNSLSFDASNDGSLDPETWIYLNNAIAERNAVSDTADLIRLAVVVSIPEISQDASASANKEMQGQAAELLRGVALQQAELNCGIDNLADSIENLGIDLNCSGREGRLVHVTIADDTSAQHKTLDDEKKRSVARAIASELVDNNVQAVVGHFSSSNCEAAGEIYRREKIVMVSPTCTKTSLTNNEYFFRTIPSDQIAAQKLADSYVNGNKISDQEVSIAYSYESAYARSFRDAFESSLSGSYVSQCSSIGVDAFDPEVCAQKTNNTNPDFLLLTAPSSLRVRSLSILTSLDENITPLGSDSMYGPEAISKEYAERVSESGLLVYVSWHPDPDIRTPFEMKANRLFKISNAWNWRTQSSYDATSALIKGIRILGSEFDGERLKNKLKEESFSADGVVASDSVRFDSNGERVLEGDRKSVV